MKAEHILVTRMQGPDYFPPAEIKPGVCEIRQDLGQLLEPRRLMLVQREMAETNPEFRQIIPYMVLRNLKGEILVYQRMAKAGEQRLAGKTSIGFGGHIDAPDVAYGGNVIDLRRTIRNAVNRELSEELMFIPEWWLVMNHGYIVDDVDMVGKVHLGLFMSVMADPKRRWEASEEDLQVLGWKRPEDIDTSNMEKWSAACLNHFMEKDSYGLPASAGWR